MIDMKENERRDKFVAKALEGYEQNYKGITQAIEQMEVQLENYKEQQADMLEGITEMKDILGLTDEMTEEEKFPPLATLESIEE